MTEWVKWTSDLEVGVKIIDDQHKELFSRMNKLYNAVISEENADSVFDVFCYLEQYIFMHFQEEENLMDRKKIFALDSAYYKKHIEQHTSFASNFREFKKDMKLLNENAVLMSEFLPWIKNWIFFHISGTDKHICRFTRRRTGSFH